MSGTLYTETDKNKIFLDFLQAAIEGNKREGRRGSYGSFASSDMLPMSHHGLGGIPGMPSQISPMSLVTSHQRQFNGSSHHGMPPSKSFFQGLA